MDMNAKSYKVVIDGEEYDLVSDEGEAHIAKAASLVSEVIHSLSSDIQGVDKRKVAMLVALQFASKFLHAEQRLTQRKEQEDELIAWTKHKLASL